MNKRTLAVKLIVNKAMQNKDYLTALKLLVKSLFSNDFSVKVIQLALINQLNSGWPELDDYIESLNKQLEN